MRLYHSSTAAWQAMKEACESAKKSIDFEEYILHNDGAGNELLAIFMAKARVGVRVRLLFDAFGSRRLLKHKVLDDLHKSGVQLAFYRPINFVQLTIPSLSLPRDHAKALHIDGAVSFIGSMCVAAHMFGWRDTLLVIEGHVAARSRLDFDRVWTDQAFNIQYRPCVDVHRDTSDVNTYAAQMPELGLTGIVDALVSQISGAQRTILIATPYFFPPRKLRRALIDAQTRGVEVTLLLASETDTPLADTVTRGLVGYWRSLGFEVLFYQPAVFHAKYAIIDEDWITAGSCNFDLLSLKYNREANVVLRDPSNVAQFLEQCVNDLSSCKPVPATRAQPSLWDQAVGILGAQICRCF